MSDAERFWLIKLHADALSTLGNYYIVETRAATLARLDRIRELINELADEHFARHPDDSKEAA